MEAAVSDAAEVLRAGGVVLYPTDTLYGLGADALSDDAVEKIYAIKGRADGKPIHAIVADLGMAEKYAVVTDEVRLLAERLPQGQVTFILPAKGGSASGGKKLEKLNTGILRGRATFGFRIPDNEFCISLTREFGQPITATSANKSDVPPERSVRKILAQLGDAAHSINLAIEAGELPHRLPSTVVDLSGEEPAIIREGAIPAADVWNVLSIGSDIAG
jgi:L-threonylcarbamoyladenylate synthase